MNQVRQFCRYLICYQQDLCAIDQLTSLIRNYLRRFPPTERQRIAQVIGDFVVRSFWDDLTWKLER